MHEIILMGHGAWGKAIDSLLTQNGVNFQVWKKNELISDNSTVIGTIPTQGIRESLATIGNPKNLIYINCAKGIETGTRKLPNEIVAEVLGTEIDYFTLLGPSFSHEVEKQMPTLVNLGYTNPKKLKDVKDLFQTDYFRVKPTRSIGALELSAALKNVYAIACGVADGLGFKMNTRVKLMVLALCEINSLTEKLGYEVDTDALPATVGDLVLTCSSLESRNFSFGRMLATKDAKSSLESIHQTVEGYFTSETIPFLEKETGLSLPLARFVYELTHEKIRSVENSFSEFVKTT